MLVVSILRERIEVYLLEFIYAAPTRSKMASWRVSKRDGS